MNRSLRLSFVFFLWAAAGGCIVPGGSTSDPTAAAPADTAAPLPIDTASPSPAPTLEPTATEGPFLLQTPDPLFVEPELDGERAVTAVIPVEGGTITAEAADGSVFTLTIPPNALLSEQSVTLTPLTGVSGQDLSGGFVAGVDLAPDGLALYAAAQLSIFPARPIAPADELSFAVHGEAHEAFLYPLLPQAGVAVFAINHFSAYYLAEGGPSDVLAQLKKIPTSIEDQLQQQITDLINRERRAGLVGEPGDPEYDKLVAAYLLDYWNKVLVPHIEQAKNSHDWRFICQVIDEVLGFARTLQIADVELDIQFDHIAIVKELLLIEGGLLVEYSYELCEDDRLLAGWAIVLRVIRTYQVFELGFDYDMLKWQTFCPPPRLTFTSQTTSSYLSPYGSIQVSDVRADSEVELTYDPSVPGFRGSGPIEVTVLQAQSLNGVQSDGGVLFCTALWAPEPSVLEVKKLVLNLNRNECRTADEAEKSFTQPALELVMNTGKPAENYTEDCSEPSAAALRDIQERDPVFGPMVWWWIFDKIHQESKVEADFKFVEWQYSPDFSAAFKEFVIDEPPGFLVISDVFGNLETTRIEVLR